MKKTLMSRIAFLISSIILSICFIVCCKTGKETGTDIIDRSITAKKAYAMVKNNKDIVLVDVRTKGEYTDEHIEHAIFIDSFSKTMKEDVGKLDKSKTYILYCLGGQRSKIVMEKMLDFGFKNIYEIGDGLMGWKEEKLPIVSESENEKNT